MHETRTTRAATGVLVAVSVVLHASLLGWAARSSAPLAPSRAPSTEIEWTVDLDAAADEPFSFAAAADSPRVDSVRAEPGAPSGAPPSASAPASDAPFDSSGAEGTEASASDPSLAGDGRATTTPGAPRLSLDQLGVGRALFLPPGASPRTSSERLRGRPSASETARRLEHDFATAQADQARRSGLGPEGPVVARLIETAYAELASLDTDARLRVVADAGGRILSIDVLSASSALPEWQGLAKKLFARLAGTRLRAMGTRGYHFTLAVKSANQLPSGASSPVSTSALGVPLSGDGKPSSEVLGAAGDLSDIGATKRRVVRAHVESFSLLPPG